MFVSRISNGKSEEQVDEIVNATRESRMKLASVDKLDVSSTITEVMSDLRNSYDDMTGDVTSTPRVAATHVTSAQTVNSSQSESNDDVMPASSGNGTAVWRPISSRVKVAMGFLWLAVPGEVPSG